MAEWSIAAVLKTVVPVRVPGVRIPLPPLRKFAKRSIRAKDAIRLLLFFCFCDAYFARNSNFIEVPCLSPKYGFYWGEIRLTPRVYLLGTPRAFGYVLARAVLGGRVCAHTPNVFFWKWGKMFFKERGFENRVVPSVGDFLRRRRAFL